MSLIQFDRFVDAVINSDLGEVKLLLPFIDPKTRESEALRYAVSIGHLDIVNLLLPLSDPKANNSEALLRAACAGHLEIVKLLIPLSDPMASDSKPLVLSAENSHFDVIRLLFPVSDAVSVLRTAQNQAWSSEGFSYLKQLVKAKEDKDFLERNLLSEKECQVKKAGPKKL